MRFDGGGFIPPQHPIRPRGDRVGVETAAPAGQRRVFLTQVIDPQGQALTFTYDAQYRLASITDAVGQVTTLAYDFGPDPLKITQVTDPFGRSAMLEYNGAGRLVGITDVMGLKSSFMYGANDMIASLTTPYGTTTFQYQQDPSQNFTKPVVQATDPLGGTERLEFRWDDAGIPQTEPTAAVPTGFTAANAQLNWYNTVHWDKRAWSLHPGDTTKATITHWLLRAIYPNGDIIRSVAVPHSVKRPLEHRVWYAYPGQTDVALAGTHTTSSVIARVLADGSTQSRQATYNNRGSLLSETDPLGRQTSYTYAANGIDLTQVRQTTGGMSDVLATYANYNALHQPQTITDAAGQLTTVTYNSAGQPLTVTNAKQETTTFAYGTNGYLSSVTGALPAAIQSFTYDGYGRPRTVTGPDGYSVTIDYDVFDRVTRVTYPDGTYEDSTYDRLDLSAYRDVKGRVTRVLLRPAAPAHRDPRPARTAVDAGVVRLRLARGDCRRQRKPHQLGARPLGACNAPSAREWQRRGVRIRRRRPADEADRCQGAGDALPVSSGRRPPAGQLRQRRLRHADDLYTYDAAYGRLATMVDGNGPTLHTYHPVGVLGAGALASVDGPLATDTVTYSYDVLDRIVGRTLNGVTGTWTLDPLGRVATQVDPIGTFTYTYDGATARLQSLTYPNNQCSTYTYLPNTGDRRLEEIHHKAAGGATLSRFAYSYDAVGNISTWTQQYGTEVRAYDLEHDAADQLQSATYRTTGGTPTLLKQYDYRYDRVGNRTNVQVEGVASTATYDSMNRLVGQAGGGLLRFAGTVSEPAAVTVQGRPAMVGGSNTFTGTATVGAGTTTVAVVATDASGNITTAGYDVDAPATTGTLTYDANGNLTAQGTRTYEWDAESRLVRVLESGSPIAQFAYDGFGRRVEKVTGGVTRTYVHDREDILEERISGGGTSRHVHGPGTDQPLAVVNGGGATSYYLADHLGSVVQTTDGSAQVAHTRKYDPFGNQSAGAGESGYAFTGREWDAEAGLYYYRSRYYDPALSRFLSEDQLGIAGGINLYAYVEGSPTRYVDPFGFNKGNKGERGRTASPDGTKDPFKKMKPHPDPTKVWYKDPHTGKDSVKPKPEGFQEAWDKNHPPKPKAKPTGPGEGGQGNGPKGGPVGGGWVPRLPFILTVNLCQMLPSLCRPQTPSSCTM